MEMNLSRLLSLLLSRLKYILLVAVIAGIASFGYTKFCVDEKYTSSSKFLIDMDIAQSKVSELSFQQSALNSYMAIFNTRDFFEEVADIYNLKEDVVHLTSSQIRSMTSITTSSSADEPTFTIKVTSVYPNLAYEIAKTVSNYAVEKIDTFEYLNTVTMVETPIKPMSPSYPSLRKNTLLGFALGLIASAALFVCWEVLDKRVKNLEDITSKFDIPVLGIIPYALDEPIEKRRRERNRKSKSRKEKK